jgi:hypothetical protein
VVKQVMAMMVAAMYLPGNGQLWQVARVVGRWHKKRGRGKEEMQQKNTITNQMMVSGNNTSRQSRTVAD